MPKNLEILTTEKSRSPTSSFRRAASLFSSWQQLITSRYSSFTLSKAPEISSQSKPDSAARFWILFALVRAGKAFGTFSMREVTRLSPLSCTLIFSHFSSTLSIDFAWLFSLSSKKTWGWRRIIFSHSSLMTSVRSNLPFSSSMCAWKTTCSSTSPSSSRKLSKSWWLIASTTSYASSSIPARRLSCVCTRSQGHATRRMAMMSARRLIAVSLFFAGAASGW